ncbi:MAG: T9SS type A sorting domain-containing protein [Calditrichaeota bacterium]|nr:T9SS type A sorting domain-containing protein [Calditrichota bacterium]
MKLRHIFWNLMLGMVTLGSLLAADSVDVTFYYRPEGNPNIVYLAGEFNNWANNSNGRITDPRFAMTYDPETGFWYKTERLRIGGPAQNPLKPGAYEYKFNENGSSSGWLSDPRNPRQDPANYYNSILYVKDPTIHYLLPNETSDIIRTRFPEISAYLFPKVGATIDTQSITVQINQTVYRQLGRFFDPETRQLRFTVPDPLPDGEHRVLLSVMSSSGSWNQDSARFTVRADLVQILTRPAETWKSAWRIQGAIFKPDGGYDSSITQAVLVREAEQWPIRVINGRVDTTIGLLEGENRFQLQATLNGQVEVSQPVRIVRKVDHAPYAVVTFQATESNITLMATESTDPDGQSLTFLWKEVPGNPETIGGITGTTGPILNFDLPTTPGEYFIQLIATDPDGNQDSTRVFVRRNRDGSITFSDYEINPEWVQQSRIYLLFFKAFTPEGTIRAAIPNLDYIKSLGFNVIWVLPVMDTEGIIDNQINIGYNIIDFYRVAPEYGTAQDFKDFVARAHELGMKVILDVTPNHTGRQHPFAQDVREWGEYSPYWYYYQTEYISHNDNGLGICRTPEGIYYYCAFSDALLNYNWSDLDARRYMIDVYTYWIREFDIDGFRFDVYWGPHRRYGSSQFDRPLRKALKHVKPDILLLAEDSGTGVGTEWIYADKGGGADVAYDFKLYHNQIKNFSFTPNGISGLHNELYNGGYFPGENAYYLRFMETQDEDRIAYFYNSFEKTMPMASVIFTAPGIPLLYNGQEVGFGKGMSAQGFDYRRRAVIDWEFPGRELLTPHYQRLAHIRAQFPAFSQHKKDTNGDGNVDANDASDFIRVSSSNGYVYAFLRPYPDENGLTVVNFSGTAQTAVLDISGAGLQFSGGFSATETYWVNDLYADTSISVSGAQLSNYQVTLPPYGSAIYVIATEEKQVVIPPLSPIVKIETEEPIKPQNFALKQNFPNPFNPYTTIVFEVPRTSRVSLEIYNILGQRVKRLIQGVFAPGQHRVQWDGRNDRGENLPSGIYILQMRADAFIAHKRLLLLK